MLKNRFCAKLNHYYFIFFVVRVCRSYKISVLKRNVTINFVGLEVRRKEKITLVKVSTKQGRLKGLSSHVACALLWLQSSVRHYVTLTWSFGRPLGRHELVFKTQRNLNENIDFENMKIVHIIQFYAILKNYNQCIIYFQFQSSQLQFQKTIIFQIFPHL